MTLKKFLIAAVVLILILSIASFLHIHNVPEKTPIPDDPPVEAALIEKTKDLINERNYFDANLNEPFWVGYDVEYNIYKDGLDYYVALIDDSYDDHKMTPYAFTEYENGYYRIDAADYSKAEFICGGSFYIDGVTKPDYYKNDNPRITRQYDYEAVCDNVVSRRHYGEKPFTVYDCYILNRFPWDLSMGSDVFEAMIIEDDRVTWLACSYNGYNMGTNPIAQSAADFPDKIERCRDTAVYHKVIIKRDNDVFALESGSTDIFSMEAYVKIPETEGGEYIVNCFVTNLTDEPLHANVTGEFYLGYAADSASADEFGEFCFEPSKAVMFSFNANFPPADSEKTLLGACTLELTGDTEYNRYNRLEIKPYTIILISNQTIDKSL